MSAFSGPGGRGASDHASLWLAGELLGSPVLEVDSALLSIAAAYGRCDAVTVLGRLDGAARILFGCRRERCEVQAERLAMVLTNVLGLFAEHREQSWRLPADRLRGALPDCAAGELGG